MANKNNNKVDKKLAYGLIGLAVVLGILIVAVFAMSGSRSGMPSQTTAPSGSDAGETTAPVGTTTPLTTTAPTVVIQQQVEEPYEKWLAGAMAMMATLDYPEFSEMELYVTGEHTLNDKMASEGAYLRLNTPEGMVLLHSAPLEAARTEAGTKDLYSAQLGYNTFEVLQDGSVDLSGYRQVTLDDLSKVIEQAIRVSLYEN